MSFVFMLIIFVFVDLLNTEKAVKLLEIDRKLYEL